MNTDWTGSEDEKSNNEDGLISFGIPKASELTDETHWFLQITQKGFHRDDCVSIEWRTIHQHAIVQT